MPTIADVLAIAFDKAELETARMYDGHTCSMKNINGEEDCPICYFRKRVKAHLGLERAVAIIDKNESTEWALNHLSADEDKEDFEEHRDAIYDSDDYLSKPQDEL